ncbi:MAG TPA: hypothetical protein VND24_05655 [Steroidobacteraceae bacterium]|nr:hypothetical protein [Steroidobacteraceae bacterium]
MKHRNVRGTILYTSRKPERMGERRGIEHFNFTHHADGCTTLRAYVEIEEPDPTVLRDVIYSLDAQHRPRDCHVRLTVADRFMGSGWFRFTPGEIECESYGPTIGRISQRMPLERPIDGFGTHPVVADGYLLSVLPWRQDERRTLHVFVPSPDHRGATPPLLSAVAIDAVFLGHERIEVRAGTFRARHFQYLDEGDSGMLGRHPPYDVWISDDHDGVLLQGGVGGYMQTWYELVALER